MIRCNEKQYEFKDIQNLIDKNIEKYANLLNILRVPNHDSNELIPQCPFYQFLINEKSELLFYKFKFQQKTIRSFFRKKKVFYDQEYKLEKRKIKILFENGKIYLIYGDTIPARFIASNSFKDLIYENVEKFWINIFKDYKKYPIFITNYIDEDDDDYNDGWD